MPPPPVRRFLSNYFDLLLYYCIVNMFVYQCVMINVNILCDNVIHVVSTYEI